MTIFPDPNPKAASIIIECLETLGGEEYRAKVCVINDYVPNVEIYVTARRGNSETPEQSIKKALFEFSRSIQLCLLEQ